jgi:alkylation response protein AidB-like acyl-CoA dehydrogenase
MLGSRNVMGLTGTGSYDYRVPEQFIAASSSWSAPSLCHGLASRAAVYPWHRGRCLPGHAAVAVGLVKRSLQEIARIAADRRRPGYPSVIADHPVFRREFAIREAAAQASQASVMNVFANAQATVLGGRKLSPMQRARFRQSMICLQEVGAELVRFC